MALMQRFVDHIFREQLFQRGDHLLLTVSGGMDSSALCELCHRAGFRFSIAHANFGLRGEESEGDEQFVRELASHYQVPVHVKLFDTAEHASSKKISIQVAARELRYAWFRELLHAGHQWLLTAHHADDNIETMLMHFFRGTGISGLRGMLPKTERIVRPLLPFFREEILAFCQENNLNWREDSSNQSDKYSRNYFRNTVIPLVRNIYPEARANLSANLHRFAETEELFKQAVATQKKKLTEIKGEELHIPVLKLKKTTPLRTMMYEIIREYGFSSQQVDDALHLLDAEQGKWIASASHQLLRNRAWLIIAPLVPQSDGLVIITAHDRQSPDRTMQIIRKPVNKISDHDASSALLDAAVIEFPLLLRPWKTGDYFYPLGMKKKKKVSRFLIDQKLSPTEKNKVRVLESGKRICWVVGLRIDDRFRITGNTKELLHLVYNNQLAK